MLLLAVIAGICICIVLGFGMPTSAAYLIVAPLLAPTYFGEFGVAELPSHFFVFYSASLATITPPIATGIVVASGIAGANFWSTAKQALKISLHLFVLPVMFIYNPETISSTISLGLVVSGLLGLLGSIAMIYGINKPRPTLGRIPKRSLNVAYVVLGVLMMVHPDEVVRFFALVLALVVFSMEEWSEPLLTHRIFDFAW